MQPKLWVFLNNIRYKWSRDWNCESAQRYVARALLSGAFGSLKSEIRRIFRLEAVVVASRVAHFPPDSIDKERNKSNRTGPATAFDSLALALSASLLSFFKRISSIAFLIYFLPIHFNEVQYQRITSMQLSVWRSRFWWLITERFFGCFIFHSFRFLSTSRNCFPLEIIAPVRSTWYCDITIDGSLPSFFSRVLF